jgi:hypothetical protein
VISPLLSNLYLNEVDRMLERAKEVTRRGKFTYVEYARYADDLVILVDAYPQHDWLLKAVGKRLREELAQLGVEVNEEKSRVVDLAKGESFGFLGFEFRRIRSLRGVWRAQYAPKLKKRTALLQKLKEIFRRYQSEPAGRVVQLIVAVHGGCAAVPMRCRIDHHADRNLTQLSELSAVASATGDPPSAGGVPARAVDDAPDHSHPAPGTTRRRPERFLDILQAAVLRHR